MKHRKANRILGRNASHRMQLLKNLSSELLKHGAIVTTTAKAKALRRHFEPLITQARKEITLHQRRQLLKQVGQSEDVQRLIDVAVKQQRPGGYTRITALPSKRADSAKESRIEIVE